MTLQFRMSVLLAREEEAKRAEEKAAAANSPLLYNHKIVNGDKISKVTQKIGMVVTSKNLLIYLKYFCKWNNVPNLKTC